MKVFEFFFEILKITFEKIQDELSLTNIANRNLQSVTMKKDNTKTEMEVNEEEVEEEEYEVLFERNGV